jgi:hypothetical protein
VSSNKISDRRQVVSSYVLNLSSGRICEIIYSVLHMNIWLYKCSTMSNTWGGKWNIVLQFRVWKSIKRNIVLEALNTSEVGRQGDQETTVHSHTSHYRIFSVIDWLTAHFPQLRRFLFFIASMHWQTPPPGRQAHRKNLLCHSQLLLLYFFTMSKWVQLLFTGQACLAKHVPDSVGDWLLFVDIDTSLMLPVLLLQHHVVPWSHSEQ